MIWKSMEIHNAAELVERDGGVTWTRVPGKIRKGMEKDNGSFMAGNSTGVELRFVMKSDEVRIRMAALAPSTSIFHVFRGAIQGGWEDHEVDKYIFEEPREYVIRKSENTEVLKRIAEEFGQTWDPEVVRVVFDRGSFVLYDVIGEVEPPRVEQCPPQTLLAYGSSITHGSNSIDASHSWVWQTADRLKMDYRNLGMAGACAMEPDLVDYIAAEGEQNRWAVAVLELGINVLDWAEDKIHARTANTLRQIAGRNQEKPVVVISPFYCSDDYKNVGKAARWREIIEEEVKKAGYTNVTYINGLDLLGDMSLISADEVHPNIYGVQQIADRLTERLKETGGIRIV